MIKIFFISTTENYRRRSPKEKMKLSFEGNHMFDIQGIYFDQVEINNFIYFISIISFSCFFVNYSYLICQSFI